MPSGEIHSSDNRTNHQVLFMDQEEVENRTQSNHTMSYYQVATPKSPHELSSIAENEDEVSQSSHPYEDAERLKFISAKREILDQVNLQIMLTHREMENMIEESNQVSGQLEVLKILHEDPELLKKVEDYQDSRAKQVAECVGSIMHNPAEEGNFYYHTRSKSGSNVSGLRLANDNVIDSRMKGNKSLPDITSSNGVQPEASKTGKLPQHSHQRNFSSTCATSNSGIIGTTEAGQPIFRRPDGILIIITCSQCGREGFTSAQGIVNHMRLKHSLHYQSQPLAVLNNQVLLPDEKQDQNILTRFKEADISPISDYLSTTIPLPANDKRQTIKEKSRTPSISEAVLLRSTKRLEKMYGKDDFKELVDFVKDSDKDLDNILKYQVDESPESTPEEDPSSSRGKPRKRTLAHDKNRPAEKKARPDVIHVTELHIPEEDKRSKHYNLRAKSKLKALNRDD